MFRPEHMCWSCSWRTTGALTRGTRIRCASWAEPAPPESEKIERFGSALWKKHGKILDLTCKNSGKCWNMRISSANNVDNWDFINNNCGNIGFNQKKSLKWDTVRLQNGKLDPQRHWRWISGTENRHIKIWNHPKPWSSSVTTYMYPTIYQILSNHILSIY